MTPTTVTGTVIAAAWNYIRWADDGDPRRARPRAVLLAVHAVVVEDQRGCASTVVMRWWQQADGAEMRRFCRRWQTYVAIFGGEQDAVWWPSQVARQLDELAAASAPDAE